MRKIISTGTRRGNNLERRGAHEGRGEKRDGEKSHIKHGSFIVAASRKVRQKKKSFPGME